MSLGISQIIRSTELTSCCLGITLVVSDQQDAYGEASAQSNLKECPKSESARWHNCFGTQTWANGDTYVGEWKDDKRHGQGTFTRADGRKYVGEFRNDKKHGQGTKYYASGTIYRQGIFKNDVLVKYQDVQERNDPPTTRQGGVRPVSPT